MLNESFNSYNGSGWNEFHKSICVLCVQSMYELFLTHNAAAHHLDLHSYMAHSILLTAFSCFRE